MPAIPTVRRVLPFIFAGLAVAGCGTDDAPSPLAPEPETAFASTGSRSADRCMNVDVELVAPLGLWIFEGNLVPGGVPSPVTLGGVDGWLASILENPAEPPKGRSSTTHWELTHLFFTAAPTPVDISGSGFFVPSVALASQPDWFLTDDRAVCADAGAGPLVCRVNDQMPIVAGAGIFAHATGFLHNHGTITVVDPTTGAGFGDFHARGRICGDGVGG